MSIAVVTDSGGDLDLRSLQSLSIELVPLTVRLDSTEFIDQIELPTEEFWARCKSGRVTPSTAAPSIGSFQEAFVRASQGHSGVICITLAAEMSGTYQAAVAAARGVKDRVEVAVVDSRSASAGEGFAVKLAASLCADGSNSLAEVVDRVEEAIRYTKLFGTLDTLEYLRRGGRIGSLKFLVGQALSFKPVIEITEGKIDLISRQRSRRKSIDALLEAVASVGRPMELSVVHGDAPDIDMVVERLTSKHPSVPLEVKLIGAVVGSHVGPGTLGVAVRTAS